MCVCESMGEWLVEKERKTVLESSMLKQKTCQNITGCWKIIGKKNHMAYEIKIYIFLDSAEEE